MNRTFALLALAVLIISLGAARASASECGQLKIKSKVESIESSKIGETINIVSIKGRCEVDIVDFEEKGARAPSACVPGATIEARGRWVSAFGFFLTAKLKNVHCAPNGAAERKDQRYNPDDDAEGIDRGEGGRTR